MFALVTVSILRGLLAFAWLGLGSLAVSVAARRRRYVNNLPASRNSKMKIANWAMFAGGLISVGLGVYNVYRLLTSY